METLKIVLDVVSVSFLLLSAIGVVLQAGAKPVSHSFAALAVLLVLAAAALSCASVTPPASGGNGRGRVCPSMYGNGVGVL